ncbi:MAG: DUF4037 domain-containing protein [Veillonella sp.]|uniref:DUF4037 domain-containing protein n=1 Tax=Veillonella sp. TaxID=1926307 RepID=UPI0025D2BE84|nr:DUF4037 domain-containing protein [Veillonella sp.]MBS4913113.1 DUF4037 domain-containing protein [Veillonella sp.]
MTTVESLVKEAHRLWREGNELAMIPLLEEAIRLSKEIRDYKKTIEIQNELGGCYRNTGQFEKAIAVLKEALALYDAHMPKQPIAYATMLVNLGNIYREHKSFYEAEQCFQQAQTIFKNEGDKSYAYVGLLNNFSLLYQDVKEYTKAHTMQEETIALLETDPSLKVPLAISYQNLCEIKKHTAPQNPESGLPFLEKAEAILLKEVGTDHPLYAAVLNTKADYALRQKKYNQALHWYTEALAIIKKHYGETSIAYDAIMQNLVALADITKTLNGNDVGTTQAVMQQHTPGKREEYNASAMWSSIHNDAPTTPVAATEPDKAPVIATPKGEGLRLAEEMALGVCSIINTSYRSLLPHICLVLAGTGSECLGYDDLQSQDHDFKKRCQLILPKSVLESQSSTIAALVAQCKRDLSGDLEVKSIDEFYSFYSFFPDGPKTLREFRKVPSDCLRCATNGIVFADTPGQFTAIRERLLNYFPEDLRLKKITFCLNKMAQSGQYNFSRTLNRLDYVAATLACSEFVNYYLQLVHHLNRRYMPFYKWAYRSAMELPILHETTANLLLKLVQAPLTAERQPLIEAICADVIKELHKLGLSRSDVDFLTYQAQEVVTHISDESLRREDSWTE